MMTTITKFVLLFTFAASLEAANILILSPMPFYSHTYAFVPIFKELAVRGHNVTFVSPYPLKDPPPNWRDVEVGQLRFHAELSLNPNAYTDYLAMIDFCKIMIEQLLQDKKLMEFLEHDTTKYDVLLQESYFCQESLIAISHKLNIPIITYHAISLTPWTSFLSGNEVALNLQPNLRSPYTHRMNFFQRFKNFFINVFEICLFYYHYIPYQQALMDKYIRYPGYEQRPPLLDMLRNNSLTLFDYHFSVGYPAPLLPNSIPIGGLSTKNEQLTKEFKTLMDNAKEGVVYLNFGSVAKTTVLPDGIFEKFLAAMGELNYTVLFKSDHEHVPSKPDNVILQKWFPQPGILAHPNTRIFITHAGLHGITEAQSEGVPVLCIPIFGDQEYNSRYAELSGFGITILPKQLTKEKIVNSVLKIINDPRYKQNAVAASKIVYDRPTPPIESAIYWIEYVLRHKGARHLRRARNDLSLYQVLGIDIALFLMSIVAIPVVILLTILLRKKNRPTKAKRD